MLTITVTTTTIIPVGDPQARLLSMEGLNQVQAEATQAHLPQPGAQLLQDPGRAH